MVTTVIVLLMAVLSVNRNLILLLLPPPDLTMRAVNKILTVLPTTVSQLLEVCFVFPVVCLQLNLFL